MKNAVFTKRIFSLLLALIVLYVSAGCSKREKASTTSTTEAFSTTETGLSTDAAQTGEFVKPENYATVLLVTINPQLRLYLDANGLVLAVEAVNKDAEEIKESLSFENSNYEAVVEEIVTKSDEKGYIKSNAIINVEITEITNSMVNTVDILNKVTITVKQTATKLELKVKIKTENNTTVESNADAETTQATEESNISTEQETTTASESLDIEPVACSHRYADATCTTPKTCSNCGVTEGEAIGHNYKEATCTTPMICTRCDTTNGVAAGHSWSKATCTTPKTCTKCKTTEGNAVGHSWKNATCTAPKTCSECNTTEGIPLAHNYQAGSCTVCGYIQLGVGQWNCIVYKNNAPALIVTLNPNGANKAQLFNVETAEKVWLDDAPTIIHQGVTYVCWYNEGCICYSEATDNTLTVYLAAREKIDNWPDVIKLERSSATQMVVTESTGEGQNYFSIEPGCVFSYQSN